MAATAFAWPAQDLVRHGGHCGGESGGCSGSEEHSCWEVGLPLDEQRRGAPPVGDVILVQAPPYWEDARQDLYGKVKLNAGAGSFSVGFCACEAMPPGTKCKASETAEAGREVKKEKREETLQLQYQSASKGGLTV